MTTAEAASSVTLIHGTYSGMDAEGTYAKVLPCSGAQPSAGRAMP